MMSSPEQIEYSSKVLISPDHRHKDINIDVATKSYTIGCNRKDKATHIWKPAANQA